MKPKILKTSRICLYCGIEIPVQYEEYNEYYECDCPNAKKKRKIEEEIRKLERTIPPYEYVINQESVLYKRKN